VDADIPSAGFSQVQNINSANNRYFYSITDHDGFTTAAAAEAASLISYILDFLIYHYNLNFKPGKYSIKICIIPYYVVIIVFIMTGEL
jgi:hypothetical protein